MKSTFACLVLIPVLLYLFFGSTVRAEEPATRQPNVDPQARIIALQSLTRHHDRTRSRIKALDYMVKTAPGVVGSPEFGKLFIKAAKGHKKSIKKILGTEMRPLIKDKKFLAAALKVFGDGKLERALQRHTEQAKPYFKLRINALQRAMNSGKLTVPPVFTEKQEIAWRKKNAVVFAAALISLKATEVTCHENQARLQIAMRVYRKLTGKVLKGKPEIIAQVLLDRGLYTKNRWPICPHDGRPLIIKGEKVYCTNHVR